MTGTNKDESAVRAPKKREEKKIYPNDPVSVRKRKEIQTVLRTKDS